MGPVGDLLEVNHLNPIAGGSVTRPVTLEELEKMVWSHKENSDCLRASS